MNHDDFDFEPIAGLPAGLPRDERILWRGQPAWGKVARRIFHARTVTLYLAILLAFQTVSLKLEGWSGPEIASALFWPVVITIGCVSLLTLLGWATARTTFYTITDRRLVLHFGIALPMSVNLPFKLIKSADMRLYRDGTADIPVTLAESDHHLAYLHIWPHARPWRLRHTQPMMRCVPDGREVAAILGSALEAHASHPALKRVERQDEPRAARQPARHQTARAAA